MPAVLAVYPRWRGEHLCARSAAPMKCGLSPLARGTPDGLQKATNSARFIPAGAGNTTADKAERNDLAVYPRWRGEHPYRHSCAVSGAGLSPLARGTRLTVTVHDIHSRFIPAGAGNTETSTLGAPPAAGLSPLARGTRLIRCTTLSVPAVYPRWRGEHNGRLHARLNASGLSPLARGTLQTPVIYSGNDRFIPAGAGNTVSPSVYRHKYSVYPRWRGEHLHRFANITSTIGLSPLARGTQGHKAISTR